MPPQPLLEVDADPDTFEACAPATIQFEYQVTTNLPDDAVEVRLLDFEDNDDCVEHIVLQNGDPADTTPRTRTFTAEATCNEAGTFDFWVEVSSFAADGSEHSAETLVTLECKDESDPDCEDEDSGGGTTGGSDGCFVFDEGYDGFGGTSKIAAHVWFDDIEEDDIDGARFIPSFSTEGIAYSPANTLYLDAGHTCADWSVMTIPAGTYEVCTLIEGATGQAYRDCISDWEIPAETCAEIGLAPMPF